MKRIYLQDVQVFIRRVLPEKLQTDLRRLKMIKEADVEVCAYHHLRKYLRSDHTWRVFARKHCIHTGYYIDLLIFHNTTPKLAIELKWNRKQISGKDRRSLNAALTKLGVNKAYFITTLSYSQYTKITKEELEKYRLFEIRIPLALDGEKLKIWKQRRESFRSKMSLGRKAA